MNRIRSILKCPIVFCVLTLLLSGSAMAYSNLPTVASLGSVNDVASAVNAIEDQATVLEDRGQLETPVGMDKMAAVAETAIYRSASTGWLDNPELMINAESVAELATRAAQTLEQAEEPLLMRGVEPDRDLFLSVRFRIAGPRVALTVMPDIITSNVDKVIVETPLYQITLPIQALADDLAEPLEITLCDVSETSEIAVEVTMSNPDLAGFFLLSLPFEDDTVNGSLPEMAVSVLKNTDGIATVSKYNDITQKIDGKVSIPGTYITTPDGRSIPFSDIGNLSASVKNAIQWLRNMEIVDGVGGAFYPEGKIKRMTFAKMIVNAIHRRSSSARATYRDVTQADWYYIYAASAQKYSFIEGYEDNTFRGENLINRAQISKILGRILVNEGRFRVPSNRDAYLRQYQDSIPEYARDYVALLTRIGVMRPVNGRLDAGHEMTRAEIAVLLKDVLDKM